MGADAGEGLRFIRAMMVLSGLSPLFALWAIRGLAPVPDKYWISFCVSMVVIPNAFLLLRLLCARYSGDTKMLTIGTADDHREHLLVYLFAMVLPLYDLNVNDRRGAYAMVAALAFIVFLFWHLHLHYMNIVWAVLGYRVYTVRPLPSDDGISGREPFIVLTKRTSLREGERFKAIRLSNRVFWEFTEVK